jgi:predicted acylesterase/phospholipase RssA
MGGGVSLGTFSGAALSEVLKLVLLRGRDREGRRFARIRVDVFSGASAGAMSLALMLRSLVHRTPEELNAAEANLTKELGEEFANADESLRRLLIDAQVVQDLQAKVWGSDITIERLLAVGSDPPRDLSQAAGVLDRTAVDEIAKKELEIPPAAIDAKSDLLADRVLFACALTNLTAILCDARRDLDAEETGLLALSDGLTSRTHRELRVFDLNFERVDPAEADANRVLFPRRWCRYRNGPEAPGVIGNIRERATWMKIAATAIAAGAFPIAFEPVVLSRSRYEYGDLWPEELADREKYPFTFMDGGALNNEPIREAFRLSAFIDGQDPSADIERCIVFVDPNVRAPTTTFTVPIHRRFIMRDPNLFRSLDGFDLDRATSLDRLLAHVGSLAGTIVDEAQVIEGDRVFLSRKRFELRDTIRRFVQGALGNAPNQDLFDAAMRFCQKELEDDVQNSLIPPGPLTLEGELERVLAEEIGDGGADLAPLRGHARTFCRGSDQARDPNASLWMRALLFVAIDLILDLEGKRRNARLIAMAPVKNIRAMANHVRREARERGAAATENVPDPEIVPLPGGKVQGFGGFCSRKPGQFEMQLAKYCAREFLEACRLITQAPIPPSAVPVFTEQDAYLRELRAGLSLLGDRVARMIEQATTFRFLPVGNAALLGFIAGKIKDAVRGLADETPPSASIELRVIVPDKRFELDGAGLGDQDLAPVAADGRLALVLPLKWRLDKSEWAGPYIDGKRQILSIDRDGVSIAPDRHFCDIRLPSPEQVRAAILLPSPKFVATIVAADKEKQLDVDRWTLDPGVTPLEEQL